MAGSVLKSAVTRFVNSSHLLNGVRVSSYSSQAPFRICGLTSCLVSRKFSTTGAARKKEAVEVTFIKGNGEKVTAKGKEGESLLDIVVNNSVDIDGYGACEGTLTCSTCHLVLKKEDYDSLPSKPTDEELDMLDLAYGLTDTSRLGCQICMTKELNGLEVRVPEGINDARSN